MKTRCVYSNVRRARRASALAFLVVPLLAMTLSAQRARTPPARNPSDPIRPNWAERKASDAGWLPLPAADRPALLARWAEYDRLFAAADSMARPQGFSVVPGAISYGEMPPGRLYNFFLRYLFLEGNGRSTGEGPALLGIWENPGARDVWVADSGPPTFTDARGEMYFERARGQQVPGLPPGAIVFDGPLRFDSKNASYENAIRVLLTASGEAPWTDVSRERVLQSLIANAKKEAAEVEQMYADPAYRQAVDAAAPGSSDKLREMLANVRAPVTLLTNRLTAMSAADRAAPAWVRLTAVGTYEFGAPGTQGFYHVIADRPDYYRAAGSRTAVRAMLVRFQLTNAAHVAWDRAVEDSFKAFDWTALARLLTK